MKTAAVSLVALVVALVSLAAGPNEFVSTWKAPGAAQLNFTGRKVAAVLISDDTNLRVSAEEALAREISARGSNGVPSYRMVPKELLSDKAGAKAWFERSGIAGLVALRPVATDTTKVYSSVVWSSGYYNYAWDYWGDAWASVYPIGKGRDQRTITVETMLYDLSNGSPIWACVTRTTDPKDVQSYVKLLAVDIVKRLEQDGLVAKRPR
jgi:hypothetical protein